ncbi:hypothetical protein BGZ72_008848 [Mortierella alpina]|nr:hypothetical protein BGZ72_008848 [Mortierella alpina]
MNDTQSFRLTGTTDIVEIPVNHARGLNIIYWEDIEQVYPAVRHVQNGRVVVDMLRDSDEARHFPGVVLDVVVPTITGQIHFESTADTPISDVNVSCPLPLPSMSSSGLKAASKVALSDPKPSTSTTASGPWLSLNESIDQLNIKSGSMTDLDPSEPFQICPSKKSTIQIQEHMKALTDAMIAANRAGKPLDTSNIPSIVADILPADVRKNRAAPAMAVPGFETTVINKLEGIRDQALMTQQIVQQVLEETQQIKDRLSLLQSKTEAILIQNYELLEYTIPRLFIVLPETSTSWDPASMFRTRFRLHFICECGEHTKASGSKIPHHLHLANHEGYVVNKPTEFFEKYGPFLMLMLNMIKLGMSIAGHVVPALSTLRVVDVLDAPQSALNSVTNNVIKGVDYSLAFLEESRTSNKKSDDDDAGADAEGRTLQNDLEKYLDGTEGLEGVDLHQLRSYLVSNNADNLLGNMYRMTTKEGHVKWVCCDHYRAGYQEGRTQKLRDVVEVARGIFDEQLGKVEIALNSSLAAEEFYDAVSKAKGILHLNVSLRWRQQYADFVKLKKMVSISNIRKIKVDLACKTAPTIDKIKTNVGKSRRYDPIFEIMRLPSIQSFEVERAPFDFFDRSNRLPSNADLTNLRHLRIDGPRIAGAPGFKVAGLDEDSMTKLKMMLAQAPNLSCLSLTTSLRCLPELFSSIAEYQTYPIVFENLMVRFLPPKSESRPPRTVVKDLPHFFKVYGAQLEVMDYADCTLQGLEYDGSDIVAAMEWLKLEGIVLEDGRYLDDKYIKDLGVVVDPLGRIHGLVDGNSDAQTRLGYKYEKGDSVPQDYRKAAEWYLRAANQGDNYAQNNLGFLYDQGKAVPQDYSKAMEWYLKAASQGNALAQNNIGVMYDKGQGVPQDYARAMECQGNADAQNNIGVMYEKGQGVPQDYTRAMEWYQKAASQGNALNQNNIGVMYDRGRGVTQDNAKAAEWYLKAANQGNDHAQNNLGFLYEQGNGVPQDYAKAMEWYLKAANQGNVDAQNNIGVMYDKGQGVTQHYATAMEWYLKAANQGNAHAQNSVGFLYNHGKGVPQDYPTAMEWYLKAANQGNADAQNNIGEMYYNGQGVPQDYAAAMEWYLKAANQGDDNAQNNIGAMYDNGQGVPQDYAAAMEWYLKAANQGNGDAQNNLGFLYDQGKAVPQDYSRAMEWYLKAANQGNALAQESVGFLYDQGKGVPQDYRKAKEWYLKAAIQGDADAQKNLGTIYAKGKGVPRDYAEAMEWYSKAAAQENAGAQNNIGTMYSEGKGVPQNYATALEWYLKAANQGHARSQNIVGNMYKHGKGVPQDYATAMEWYLKAVNQGNADAQSNLDNMRQLGEGILQDC